MNIIIPHVQHERGKVISVGVCVYICLWTKKIESYFSNRLTFSNICGKTSRKTYRQALPLLSPEKFSSLSKLRNFLFNAHCALFLRRMTKLQSLNSIGKYRQLVK